jgi:hypothetical protein
VTRALSFSVTRNGDPIQTVEFGESLVQAGLSVDVGEVQPVGFQVLGREPNTEYGVWIGDIAAETAQGATKEAQGTVVGQAFGPYILWNDAPHFEGARGLVWIRLASRPAESSQLWRDRLLLPVIVVSTKLSEARYRAMYDELRGLASGLVLDLISKSLRSIALSKASGAPSVRSSLMDLRILERLWPTLANALGELALEPVKKLRIVQETRACWGSERLSPRAVERLATIGIDPRRHGLPLPFPASVERIAESGDTVEHRVIAGFLEFLEQRLEECGENIQRHIRAIEKDRPLRQRKATTGQSLYETEDLPRIRQLENQQERTQRLREQIRRARSIEPFRKVRAEFQLVNTPVFQNVEPYHRIRHGIHQYLNTGLIILDEGSDERLKTTSRMYEQWVFLQIAAAFRHLGLRCVDRQGLLHTTRRFRFTLDIDRGARVTFLSADGTAVSLRYEPWILPETTAQQAHETLYRGRIGSSAWSPDILIEFFTGQGVGDEPIDVDYAVVLDAKYSGRICEHHWTGTDKYLEIRSTRSRRQIVRQLWLVHPSLDEEEIVMRDPAIRWTTDGPTCRRDETVQGMLSLLPAEHPSDECEDRGWISRPVDCAIRFAEGLLNYVGIKNRGMS